MQAKIYLLMMVCALAACQPKATVPLPSVGNDGMDTLRPVLVSDTVRFDSDDPAIWIHPTDAAQSLVLGTDKNQDGALYVFDLAGKVVADRVVRGLQRPNNVDVEYGLAINGTPTDVAVVAERNAHQLRVFSLPDMKPLDGGGIPIFVGETAADYRDLMGIALYKRPSDGAVFAIAGRKSGPAEGYLWQYRLEADAHGRVGATLVRKFGAYSGKNEIEAIAVDDALGFVYYADEGVGVRKYHADPEKGNRELALFAAEGFAQDHEGISIYPTSDSTGYVLVSDQQANQFRVFPREGGAHPQLAALPFSTNESDGSDVTAVRLNGVFQRGLFVAMSDDKTFQFYRWEDIEAAILNQMNR